MRVLVTGGAGFIGSHVVDRLLASGHDVRIFDVRRSPWHARAEVEHVRGSLLRLSSVTRALRGCDLVVHLAASADVGEVAEHPCPAEELNARGTLNVLEAARRSGVERVVYASTIWVYDGVAGEVDEDTRLAAPRHLYTATKLAGEHYCRSYAELYGLRPTILRFGIPYGPRARPAAVIPRFVEGALAGRALTVAGDGAQSRRFVYVEDLADGVVASLDPAAANGTYNLVGDEDVSVSRIAATVREVVGDVPIERVPGRAGDFAGASVSGGRARAELGWAPRTSFEVGIRRYVDWHREHAAGGAVPPSPLPARVAGVAPALALVLFALVALVAANLLNAKDDELAALSSALVAGGTALVGWSTPAGGARGAVAGWAMAILVGLVAVFPAVRRLTGLEHPDMDLMLLVLVGAGTGAALAAGGRRALRPSDAQA